MRLRVTVITVLLMLATSLSLTAVAEEIEFAIGEYPPYISENLEGYGVVTQVVVEACRRAGLNPVFRFYPWARAYARVVSGQARASFLWLVTDERRKQVNFGEQHLHEGATVAFYKKSLFPQAIQFASYSDLARYRVVGVKGYWYESEFMKVGRTYVHYVTDDATALKILDSGRADAYIADELTGKHVASQVLGTKAEGIGYVKLQQNTRKSYIIFHKVGTKQVQARLDRALQSMHEDGTSNRLLGLQ
jgi:ABC-type amino acid transport substrate-binding protein